MGGLAGTWWRRLAVVAGTSWLQDGGGGGGLRLRALLLDLDLLDRHVRVHRCCFLDGLGERAVVVDGVSVGLDGDLLLHAGFHHAVALRLVGDSLDGACLGADGLRGHHLALRVDLLRLRRVGGVAARLTETEIDIVV